MSVEKDLRDSANNNEAASAAYLESASASAAAAIEEASALRQELDTVKEELEATRGVVDAADGRVVNLTEELEAQKRARSDAEAKRIAVQLEMAADKLRRMLGRGGGRVTSSTRGVGKAFARWRTVCTEAREEKLKEEMKALQGKAENYEVGFSAGSRVVNLTWSDASGAVRMSRGVLSVCTLAGELPWFVSCL